jgi:hypothetical protein
MSASPISGRIFSSGGLGAPASPIPPGPSSTRVWTRRPIRAATSPAIIPPSEKPAMSNSIDGDRTASSPDATRSASISAVRGSQGKSESPNPGRSGTSTRKRVASGAIFLIQWVHEPLAPWSSTSGWAFPQTRQTIEPVPLGVSLRVARDSMLEMETVGCSRTSATTGQILHSSFFIS